MRLTVGALAAGLAVASGWACTPDRMPAWGDPNMTDTAPATFSAAAAVAQPAPKSPIPDAPTAGVSRLAGATVDARVLVITTDGTDPAAAAAQAALKRLGTPFDVHDATHGARLTPDQLAAGSHGRYNAILLDRGALLTGGGASAFTNAEWQELADYEAGFGVRRAALYTLPDAGYGFAPATTTAAGTVAAHCTSDGAKVFVGANCANPIAIANAVVYTAAPADASTVPLLTDDAGHALAATRRNPDGRETLALTFSQADGAAHTMQLMYGVIRWASRGVFIGERHTYAGVQIDDLFLASAMYDGSPAVRITDADLQAFFDWQTSRRAKLVTADFRAAFCVNTAKAVAGDALTAKAQAIGSGFAWINHTWDHLDMTAMDYASALSEFTRNDDRVAQLGLTPYSVSVAVTPDVSGLTNANVLAAAAAAGIHDLVSDTSQPGYDNPSFNEGIPSMLQPGILLIPRRPTELYYSVSTTAQWVAEYNARHSANLDYPALIDKVSNTLLGYLLRGENDPWMFHQANTRDNGGGHSLLSDLLDAAFDKYAALMTVPVVSPTMDALGARVAARAQFDSAGASATIADDGSVTVHVATNAATVPVTGLCAPGAESYAGDSISYVAATPGADVTIAAGSCGGGMATRADAGTPPRSDAGVSAGRGAQPDGSPGRPDSDAGPPIVADAGVDGADPIVGVSVVPHAPPPGGCGCATGGPGGRRPSWVAAAALLLGLLVRPRRR
ncbi:MAG TPA: polysaccharide deacetylase family protein [Polyangia bacterium]|nr:polysaccharide deacetylase family protein [Polyangia bacterium]